MHYSVNANKKKLPIMRFTSPVAGLTIWLTAGIHGDERGGPAVVKEIFRRLKNDPLRRGTLYAFPMLNPEGLKKGTRALPQSDEDINRAFPGNSKGTPAGKRAWYIFHAITKTKPALVLDLHNDWKNSIPYLLLDPPLAPHHKKTYAALESLLHKSGYPAVRERKEDMKELKKSLSGSLMYSGTPASTFELGDASTTNRENINEGADIIWNILAALKMVLPISIKKKLFLIPHTYKNKTLRYSDEPKTNTSGRIKFFIRPGRKIKKGVTIAKIFGKKETLKETLYARAAGIVLGYTDKKNVSRGSVIAAFGIQP